MHDLNTWTPTLNSLRDQKDYLEELLSKTATTLNALRDRQSRNQRVLTDHPLTRSKRKKVQQNRWRTGKTIQTCENEEKVILDCLQVCESNIQTLEAIIYPTGTSWTSAAHISSNSNVDSDNTSFDWQGWTDDVVFSPFGTSSKHPLSLDQVAPDIASSRPGAGDKLSRGLPFELNLDSTSGALGAPQNSTYTKSTLSPQAAAFEPSAVHLQQPSTSLTKELDKLTISGFLATKRIDLIRRRHFSDEAVASQRHPHDTHPTLTRASSSQSCPSSSPLRQQDGIREGRARRRRFNSI